MCYRAAPVSARTRGVAAFVAAVTSGGVLLALGPAQGGADTVPSLRARAVTLRDAEHAALLRLYAAESALARARGEEALLAMRSRALAGQERLTSVRMAITARSLAALQSRLARILRHLYVQGDVDPIAVIFGASSLDEVVTGLDFLDRAAEQNRRLAREARQQTTELQGLRLRLSERRRALDTARAAARLATARLADAAARRADTVSSLRHEGTITAQRLAALQARAQEAQRASAKLVAAAAPAQAATGVDVAIASEGTGTAAPPATSAPAGERTLVVDAVAYHLPGNTASGLPVGVGVIAVDPSVIPLGTRVFVPGYGAAVAADTGTAIRGNIIDLWMPSTARARAWGRRTVTITVYGS